MEEGSRVISLPVEEEIKASYLDYAMSVIVGRAIPDVRDGLKPVQRRILYSMRELGLLPGRPYKKSARVVGETMGKYHPHGDAAIYDALARMAQDFSVRYPLVDGQGNFGSLDGDPPAAMRYTECRLSRFGELMMADVDEDTVDFGPNFDDSLREPLVLPSAVPNLLVNGSSGIAVGMATSIPPHNLGEIADALVMLIERPESSVEEVLRVVHGPDFPTGGVVVGGRDLLEAYSTGRGKVTVRGVVELEEGKRGRRALVVREIPYGVSKSSLVEAIVSRIKEGQVVGISDVRDESDRSGTRLVLELQREADPDLVLRQLYARTQLEMTYSINFLVLHRGAPRVMGFLGLMRAYLDHRREVVRRRTLFRLRAAEERVHVLEGLSKALDQIDLVISLIRSSRDVPSARRALMERVGLTERQAQGVLEMRLQRLTALERRALEEELSSLLSDVERYRSILSSPALLDEEVKREILAVKEEFSDPRRTRVVEGLSSYSREDLIAEAQMVLVLGRDGVLRGYPLSEQSRRGRGAKGAKSLEEPALLAVCSNKDEVCFFTSAGRVFSGRCFELLEERGSKRALSKAFSLLPGERVVEMRALRASEGGFLVIFTERGMVKRLPSSEVLDVKRSGRRIMGLEEGDRMVSVRFTSGRDLVACASSGGQVLVFPEEEIRPQGRSGFGVRGMRLREGERLVGGCLVPEGSFLVFATALGFGKRVDPGEFPVHHRGGLGIRGISLREGDELADVRSAMEGDELILATASGRMARMEVSSLPLLGRTARGVQLLKLEEGDRLIELSVVEGSR